MELGVMKDGNCLETESEETADLERLSTRGMLGGHSEFSFQEQQVLWVQAVFEGCSTCCDGL